MYLLLILILVKSVSLWTPFADTLSDDDNVILLIFAVVWLAIVFVRNCFTSVEVVNVDQYKP